MKTNENNMEGAGLVFPALGPVVIDRNDAGFYPNRENTADVSYAEEGLLWFLSDGVLRDTEYDDNKAGDLLKEGGYTLAHILRQQHQIRASRRQLCEGLQRYIDAVKRDEAERDAREPSQQNPAARPESSQATLATIRGFYGFLQGKYCDAAVNAMIQDSEHEFIEDLRSGSVQELYERETVKHSLGTEGGQTVEQCDRDIRLAAQQRRAFYTAVRAFVTDPATWTALDADDAPLDYPAIMAAMRSEGETVYMDTVDTVAEKGGAQ